MPRNQGTSRKGKPGKNERAVGLGRTLQRAQNSRHRPRHNGKSGSGGGMAMQQGVDSIGLEQQQQAEKTTQSVLELQDLDDFLLQASQAGREFTSERQGLVVLDETGQAYRPPSVRFEDEKPTDFIVSELSVPRRPVWTGDTTPEELDQAERQAFVDWRRAIALKEEELMKRQQQSSSATASISLSVTVTPFEKNLEVWRQLWRVLERSSCVVQLVDARNPLFYLSTDLRDYATTELGKPMLILVNKSDYLSQRQRQVWNEYFASQGWEDVVFFSAVQEQEKLDQAAAQEKKQDDSIQDPRLDSNETSPEEEDSSDADDKEPVDESANASPEEDDSTSSSDKCGVKVPLSRQALIQSLLAFARKHECQPDPRYDDRIQFGMVGFPNVGKSSVINVLVGSSKNAHGVVRVGVASRPGKTKHFQTLLIPDSNEVMLCDCPGLVFPSFVSNTADLIAAGVYPISQMRDVHYMPVTELICQRIPREILNASYGITLPTLTEWKLQERGLTEMPAPTAEDLLTTFCVARSFLAASSGVPDFPRAARVIIRDYATGKLLYCHAPPSISDDKARMAFYRETIDTSLSHTRKLREKLLLQQQSEQEASQQEADTGKANETATTATETTSNVDDLLIDEGLHDLLISGDAGTNGGTANNAATGKTRRNRTKKWGKKNRKLRNNDPYGCHAADEDDVDPSLDPNLMILGASSPRVTASAGVIVNQGKRSHKGYTRPPSRYSYS